MIPLTPYGTSHQNFRKCRRKVDDKKRETFIYASSEQTQNKVSLGFVHHSHSIVAGGFPVIS